ncbi:MAG TPA: hypothetical protein VMU95_41265 [Trebonia sp.]|nr:hypothetical protein [Trebonia sp.]
MVAVVQAAIINQSGSGYGGNFGSNVTAASSVILLATGANSTTTMSSSSPTFAGSTPSGSTQLWSQNEGTSNVPYSTGWLMPNVAGGSSAVGLTVTNASNFGSGATGSWGIEVSGLGASPTVITPNSAGGSSGSFSSGATGSTSQASIGVGCVVGFGQTVTPPTSGGWTNLTQMSSDFGCASYQLISSGSVTYAGTVSTGNWAAGAAIIESSAGASVTGVTATMVLAAPAGAPSVSGINGAVAALALAAPAGAVSVSSGPVSVSGVTATMALAAPAGSPSGLSLASGAGLQVPALFDDFNTPSTLSSKWGNSFGSPSISGGLATVPYAASGTAGLKSGTAADLTGSYYQVKVSPQIRASTRTALQVGSSSSNYFEMHYDGANLVAVYEAAGVPTTVGTVAYSATNHAWWRIREFDGSVYFDVSSDGITWFNLWSTAYSIAITSTNVQCYAADNGSGLSGTSTFANFNTNATVISPVSVVNVTTGYTFTEALTTPNCGPRAVTPGNDQGNMLLVLAAWNTASAYVPTPAGAVADNQGNWWRYVGDSGQVISGVRLAAFVCSNAMAVEGWLSFCPQGYSGSFMFQVIELDGLPASYWPLLDFHVASGTGGTSLSLSGTTATADYVFSAVANQYYGNSISSPSYGWTQILAESSGSGGTTSTTVQMSTAYMACAPLTTATAAWTIGNTEVCNSVALMVGISMASALPAQSRSVFPRVLVEQAFGANPGDNTAAILDDQWTNLGTYALGKQGQVAISSSRGQQYELAQPEAGQMTIAMNNQAGDFDPQWAGSVFYSNALNPDPAMQLLGTSGWSVTSGSAQLGMTAAQTFASAPGAYANESLGVTPSSGSVIGVKYVYSGAINVNYPVTASLWVMFPSGWASGNTELQLEATSLAGSTTVLGSQTLTNVPAGVWTQLSATGVVPADLASITALLTVSGSPTQEFYVAEVGFAIGSIPMQTGLVRLGVPTRVSCFWQGRRYPVGFGYVERWPQDWPDFPQWGWSNLIATDVVGVASSVNLPSAVQGEILADMPYISLPFNEQYTAPDAEIPLSGVDGMFAGNTSLYNAKSGTYTNGANVPVITGQTSGLLGDSGTGMGESADTSPSTVAAPGAGVLYGPDPAMPGVPCSFEFWAAVPYVTTAVTATRTIKLFSLAYPPDLNTVGLGPGSLVFVGAQFTTTNDIPSLVFATNSSSGFTVIAPLGVNNYPINGSTFSIPSNLIHIELTSSTVTVTLNGGVSSTLPYTATPGNAVAIAFGQAVYAYGNYYDTYQYAMSYGCMFPGAMPSWRQVCHVLSGLSGFGQDGLTDRALRYVAWAGLNLGLAGPQDLYSELGPAYSTAGSSLASALNGDALSFAARWAGIANGNLVLQTRQVQFNQTAAVTFGDEPVGPLNANWNFQQGLTGWSATNCTASITSAARFTFSQSCLLTFNGTSSGCSLNADSGGQIPVSPSTGYDLETWLMSPGGWYGGAGIQVDWYNSSNTYLSSTGGPDIALPPGVWVPVNPIGPSPATASYGHLRVVIGGTPPTTTQVYVDQAAIRLQNDQVTYLPAQAMDYDNTYVNNSVKASVTEGTITTATPTVVNQPSILQYFQRGPLQQAVSGTTAGDAYDRANWSIGKYQRPSIRVRSITVVSHSRPATFNSILQTDLGDPAVTIRSPLNPTRYNLPVITQRVETHIGPGTWTTDYQQSPYVPEGTVLQADVAGRDVIGSNALAW